MVGNLRLIQGAATKDGERIELPSGALGAYDRTIGHRAESPELELAFNKWCGDRD